MRALSEQRQPGGAAAAPRRAPRCAAARHARRAPWPSPPPAPRSARCRAADAPGGAAGGGGGTEKPSAAMLARIAAAKQYKAGGGAAPAAAPPAAAAAPQPQPPPPAPAPAAEDPAEMERRRAEWEAELRRSEAAARGDGSYSALLSQIESAQQTGGEPEGGPKQPSRPDFYTSPDGPEMAALLNNSARAQAPGRGSATEMASWMAGVYSEESGKLTEGLSPDLRPEEFTLAREERARAMGADIIRKDPTAVISRSRGVADAPAPADADADAGAAEGAGAEGAGAAEGEGQAYRPKVTTWGVFPRPSNISEAYGGGRNIRPGQELETPEQKAKREAEYAAALETYKRKAGLTALDPEVLAAADRDYQAAVKLMGTGAIAEALAAFNEVRESVPLKTRIGGLATLQAAICYDTLGDETQAQGLYRRLKGHPSGEVGRKARHLVFGFQAMDFLKTKNLSYSVDKSAYDKYFRRFADQSRVYVASEEEREADEAASRAAALIAAGVVLGPVAVFAAYALGR
ncbi:hypothetical protein Rsub_00800 [Raphidocelis subcapitata]|uniref:Uncharacterized protein n=1 Tax=Raphidocelis subcapitata TaxID=307507 RepID=A0A2V0NL36_9CHLO|nr:hypothetical protein Rsub_00800 [Raphidocelis subcapitata]|eukprot:GBF88088.1 hypothetical protein Rsub_00800 [Raphidocelis subcapitata]